MRVVSLLVVRVVSIVGGGASAVGAAPPEQEHGHESVSEVIEGFCGDLTLRHDVELDLYSSDLHEFIG
jgi:hypothetical protein